MNIIVSLTFIIMGVCVQPARVARRASFFVDNGNCKCRPVSEPCSLEVIDVTGRSAFSAKTMVCWHGTRLCCDRSALSRADGKETGYVRGFVLRIPRLTDRYRQLQRTGKSKTDDVDDRNTQIKSKFTEKGIQRTLSGNLIARTITNGDHIKNSIVVNSGNTKKVNEPWSEIPTDDGRYGHDSLTVHSIVELTIQSSSEHSSNVHVEPERWETVGACTSLANCNLNNLTDSSTFENFGSKLLVSKIYETSSSALKSSSQEPSFLKKLSTAHITGQALETLHKIYYPSLVQTPTLKPESMLLPAFPLSGLPSILEQPSVLSTQTVSVDEVIKLAPNLSLSLTFLSTLTSTDMITFSSLIITRQSDYIETPKILGTQYLSLPISSISPTYTSSLSSILDLEFITSTVSLGTQALPLLTRMPNTRTLVSSTNNVFTLDIGVDAFDVDIESIFILEVPYSTSVINKAEFVKYRSVPTSVIVNSVQPSFKTDSDNIHMTFELGDNIPHDTIDTVSHTALLFEHASLVTTKSMSTAFPVNPHIWRLNSNADGRAIRHFITKVQNTPSLDTKSTPESQTENIKLSNLDSKNASSRTSINKESNKTKSLNVGHLLKYTEANLTLQEEYITFLKALRERKRNQTKADSDNASGVWSWLFG
ncbi:hypothetical protein SK128_021094 [Halocaridina rubra]|uniref:Uncharacterized protein n=1 Tax=Halocaridina rubra TaxID=373956 RepID=A0AAN9AHB0_HALRR